MHARYERPMTRAFLAAALLAGVATMVLSPAISSARAQEDHSAHHAQAGAEGQGKAGEHGGMHGSGMHGGGMHGGGMHGGGMHGGMMGCQMMGGHGGHADMKGGDSGMTGGDMKGGDMRQKMRQMMHEMMTKMSSHADERVAELKNELKITDAQLPLWTGFAEALRSAAQAMERLHKEMMPAKAAATALAQGGETDFPDAGAIKKEETPATGAKHAKTLPERLDGLEKRLTQHLDNLKAIKAALDPLYATFDEQQKKTADALMVGPMGVM